MIFQKPEIQEKVLNYYRSNQSTRESAPGMCKDTMQKIIRLLKQNGTIVKKEHRHRLWTEYEDDFLRKNAKKLFAKEIAIKLERSEFSVSHRIERLGLLFGRTPSKKKRIIVRWTPEAKQRVSEKLLKKYKTNTSARVKNASNFNRNVRPTQPELMFKKIALKEKLPFSYVGNGKHWIGSKNPDFIHKQRKIIVEIFGCYWHGCPEHFPNRTQKYCDEFERKDYYLKHGYKCAVIWEHDVNNIDTVLRRIKNG
jgi:G:T-mismatch repair DNA endonuclease (very short patch repair protein)